MLIHFLVVPFSIYAQEEKQSHFTIAFGSCNKHTVANLLWDDILNTKPEVWIWGGDIIYADTDDMEKMGYDYKLQKEQANYQQLVKLLK